MIYYLRSIRQLNIELFLTIKPLDKINILEIKINQIQKFMRKLFIFRKLSFGSVITISKYNEINIDSLFKYFFNKECEFIAVILNNLRSDLQIRLREQQQALEQAKSEVEKLKQTPLAPLLTGGFGKELNQVSELQQARLDWQIAQFEELQKVLIKG